MPTKSYYEELIKKINQQKPALYPNGISMPLMIKYARQTEFGRDFTKNRGKRKKKAE